jgi:hypothetical protein
MDLRQIQALHAQYSAQPVVIDISGHAAAMPTLPAPERKSGRGFGSTNIPAKLRKAARPALICVATAAIAAGGGVSAAKLWRVLRDKPAAVHVTDKPRAAAAEPPAIGESAIDVAPAHPLTASDFGQPPATASALARVDPRSLSGNVQRPSPAADRTAEIPTDPTLARAAVSSIHPHASASGQAAGTPTSVQPVVAAPAPIQATSHTPTDAQQPAAPVAPPPSPVHAASSVEQSPKPALRPIRHVTAHHAVMPATETSTPAGAATQPATPPKAPAAKGGDVQLF